MESLLEYGYLGLFIGAFLAATLIPLSSDILLVGLLAAGANPVAAVTVAALGNWLGGMTSYLIGRAGKWQWLEKFFRIKPDAIQKQSERVARYGSCLAFFTWLPVVGDVMAVALGFYRVNWFSVAVFMLAGKSLRFVVWALLYGQLAPLVA